MALPEHIRTMVIAIMAEHLPPYLGALARKDHKEVEASNKKIWEAILKMADNEESLALVLYDGWMDAIMEIIERDHPELLPQKPANAPTAPSPLMASLGATGEAEKSQETQVVRITTMDGMKVTGYAYWSITAGKWIRDKEKATIMGIDHAMTLSFELANKYACKGQYGSVSSVAFNDETPE